MANFVEEIRAWLDTETRALLCPEPPGKISAVDTQSYALLLLRHGSDKRRTDDVVAAIQKQNPSVLAEYSFVVAQEMSLEEALAGQFALACCDCISAFVRDEIILDANREFLEQLNEQVTTSPEFELIHVKLLNIPHTEDGRRFCWQFLGMATGVTVPQSIRVFRKKARLMEHWANRSAIDLQIVDS